MKNKKYIDSGRIIISANGFFDVAEMLIGGKKYDLPFDESKIPMLTNVAFSCELYLKCILIRENDIVKRGHSLYALFNLLNDSSKDIIRKNTIEIMNDVHELKPFFKNDFDYHLKDDAKKFEQYRYFYEETVISVNLFFLISFMRALNTYCNQ